MSQFHYQNDELEEVYDYGQDEMQSLSAKRKRLAADHEYEPRYVQQNLGSSVLAWSVIGAIGLILTIGATIVAANTAGAAWTLIVPLIYMIAAMYFMTKR